MEKFRGIPPRHRKVSGYYLMFILLISSACEHVTADTQYSVLVSNNSVSRYVEPSTSTTVTTAIGSSVQSSSRPTSTTSLVPPISLSSTISTSAHTPTTSSFRVEPSTSPSISSVAGPKGQDPAYSTVVNGSTIPVYTLGSIVAYLPTTHNYVPHGPATVTLPVHSTPSNLLGSYGTVVPTYLSSAPNTGSISTSLMISRSSNAGLATRIESTTIPTIGPVQTPTLNPEHSVLATAVSKQSTEAALNPTSTVSVALAFGSSTLSAGGSAATVNGATISAGLAGAVVVNGQTMTSLPAGVRGAPIATNNSPVSMGSVLPASEESHGGIAFGSTTLTAGGAAVTTNGYTVSAGPSGAVAVNGQTVSTIPMSSTAEKPLPNTSDSPGGPAIVALRLPGGAIVVGGATLSAGGPAATIGGNVVSAGPFDALVFNGQTFTSASAGSITSTAATEPSLTGVTLSPSGVTGGGIAIGPTTLSAGGRDATVDGHTISAGLSGAVVVNGQTVTKVGPGSTAAIPRTSPTSLPATTSPEVTNDSGFHGPSSTLKTSPGSSVAGSASPTGEPSNTASHADGKNWLSIASGLGTLLILLIL